MNGAAIINLIQMRGNIVTWEHAVPASGGGIDPATRAPALTAGGPRTATGPTGETYGPPYAVRAYISRKVSSALAKNYGIQDSRSAQIDVLATFKPEPFYGIVAPDPSALSAWNAGDFCVFPANTPGDDFGLELIARDRFTLGRLRYTVEAAAVPIQDDNTTYVWRLLVQANTL